MAQTFPGLCVGGIGSPQEVHGTRSRVGGRVWIRLRNWCRQGQVTIEHYAQSVTYLRDTNKDISVLAHKRTDESIPTQSLSSFTRWTEN